MTDYEKIADWCVSEGAGEIVGDNEYCIEPGGQLFSCSTFCHDWRVVGAMMEKMGGIYLHSEIPGKWHAYAETHGSVRLPVDHATNQNESLPLAILTAIYEARKDG